MYAVYHWVGRNIFYCFYTGEAYNINIQEKKCEPACNTFVFMICILSGHTLPPMSGDLPQLVTPPEEWKGYFLYI